MNDFCGRTVLISGGTSGIGAAIGRGFAAAGAQVTVTGRTPTEVDAFLAQRTAAESSIRAEALDVADSAAVTACVERLERLDTLVTCAGMILRDAQEFDPAAFARVVDVNLTGTMRLAVACRARLKQSRGSIITTASMLTFFGSRFAPAYSASKGGVAQLTKSLAIAWAEDGIRVNAVAPGWIRTPLTHALHTDEQRSRTILERTPLGRWGEPEDVVGPVLFLASEAARFITGVVLPVDGGYAIA